MSDYDMSFLWDENTSQEDAIKGYQHLIDTGMAWRLEGHVGRTAMALIEDGQCMLGEQDYRDYYGNHVPSRHQVVPGTEGSVEYVRERHPERLTQPPEAC